MSATLPNVYALNRGTTSWARVIGLLVDLEVVLEISASINPVDTGTVVGDAQIEHLANAEEQIFSLIGGQSMALAQRIDASQEKRLVGVDITEPSEKVLI